ncbi:hypothetical protein IB238_17140 [Rhizobium sp. ARZ01]|uniref:hypothetical protein n=1 Tax=Rhizobium sp. ARZ01 TaxID=2769313 RepID=UPI00177D95D9|nr:hypothetical protein [Rhizobium sp. ARZ01]MBD9374349.1 hypothetical protein [Rhizobium sp. ARZ01]
MKYASTVIATLAVLLAVGVARADSPDDNEGQSYDLPTIVHGKTSMQQAMQSGSTFSFKLFQVDEPQKQQPYSYPEPSFNHR